MRRECDRPLLETAGRGARSSPTRSADRRRRLLPIVVPLVVGAVIVMGAASTLMLSDEVTVTVVGGSSATLQSPVAFVSGIDAGRCRLEADLVPGSETSGFSLPLGDLWSPSPADGECASELVLFDRETAVGVRMAPWTSTADVLNAALEPRLTVPLNIWVVPRNASPDDAALAGAAVVVADDRFRENRTGIRLSAGPPTTTINIATLTDSPIIGTGCSSVPALLSSPSLYRPDAINVYFVPAIKMPGYDLDLGYTCHEFGAANVIFVSLGTHYPWVLAHELGHAFGLRWNNGHLEAGPDQDSGNLMYPGHPATGPETTGTFYLGQVYRMNVDATSWLNTVAIGKSGPVSVRTGPVRYCQDSRTATYPCPKIRFKWPAAQNP